MRSGNTVFGDDFYKSTNIQSLFHQQSLATSDQEQTSVSFPNTLDLNAANDKSVDMALPSISAECMSNLVGREHGVF